MSQMQTLPPVLDRIRRPALLVGVCVLVICFLLAFAAPTQFFQSYLLAFLFWLGIALGSLALLMLQNLTSGQWGLVICRFLEAATRMLPVMAAFFLPLLLGLPYLYIWARPEAVRADPSLQYRQPYLNVWFFILRAAVYFAVWIGLMYFLNRWSIAEDHGPDNETMRRRMRLISGPGLLLYVLTMSLASVDWIMSIDPHWYSTIFGLIFVAGQALLALASMTLLLALIGTQPPLNRIVTRDHFHDLGNLLLAFVLVWVYMQFSQFLIIWMGNLQEETPFYIARIYGPMRVVALLIVIFHFAVPFLLLLSRQMKRSIRLLSAITGGIVLMRFVDLFWMVIPMFDQGHHTTHNTSASWWQTALSVFMTVAMPVGIGGIWIYLFINQLGRRPLLPEHDPRLLEPHHHAEEFHTHYDPHHSVHPNQAMGGPR